MDVSILASGILAKMASKGVVWCPAGFVRIYENYNIFFVYFIFG
jgi:hypothetical protein